MARNPKNDEVCRYLAMAVKEIKETGQVLITNAKVLTRAHNALAMEPPACPDDCLWAKMPRPQKCACCARNRRIKDLYERG